jgi:hypothetical protein
MRTVKSLFNVATKLITYALAAIVIIAAVTLLILSIIDGLKNPMN